MGTRDDGSMGFLGRKGKKKNYMKSTSRQIRLHTPGSLPPRAEVKTGSSHLDKDRSRPLMRI